MQQHTAEHHPRDPLARGPWDTRRMMDASGVIAVGGSAQYLTQDPINGFELHNPDAAEDLWFCMNGGPAVPNGSGSYRVIANGGTYWTPDHWPPLQQRVSLIAASSGHKFTFTFW